MIPVEVLARIPGCEDGRPPLAQQPLPGGRGCNEVLRVDTSQGSFVWRCRYAPINRPGSRAVDELRAQRRAAAAGLAPAILAAHPQGHWLLMEYIDAPVWRLAQLQSETGAARLAGQLARLHALPAPKDIPEVDATAMAADYLAQLAAIDPAQSAELMPLLDRVEALSSRLSASGTRPVLNHGDLTFTNLLGDVPVLVDWEYAQVAAPGWDLACLLTYYPPMSRFMRQLLAGTGISVATLELQRERFELLNRLWERVATQGAG